MKAIVLCVVGAIITASVLFVRPAQASNSVTWDTTARWDVGTKSVSSNSSLVETTTDNPSIIPILGYSTNRLAPWNEWGDAFSRNITGAKSLRWFDALASAPCAARDPVNITRGTISMPGIASYKTDAGAMVFEHEGPNATVHSSTRTSGAFGPDPDWTTTFQMNVGIAKDLNYTMLLHNYGTNFCAGQLGLTHANTIAGGLSLTHVGSGGLWNITAWIKWPPGSASTLTVCRKLAINNPSGIPMSMRISIDRNDFVYPWKFYLNGVFFTGCLGGFFPFYYRTYDLYTSNLTRVMLAVESDMAFPTRTTDFPTIAAYADAGTWTSEEVGNALDTATKIAIDAGTISPALNGGAGRDIDRVPTIRIDLLDAALVSKENWTIGPLWPFHLINWTLVVNATNAGPGPYHVKLTFHTDPVLFIAAPFVDRLTIDVPPTPNNPGTIGLGSGMPNLIWLAVFVFFFCLFIAWAIKRRRSNA